MPFERSTIMLVLLVTAVAINYLDRGALAVAAPQIASDLELSPKQMGVLFSAFFWSYATFQLAAGWMADRYPIRWVYAAGFVVWSLATAATAFTSTLSALLATRLLLGIGESVAYPASAKVVMHYFSEERRGLPNALIDAGSKVGPALSTLLGGLAVSTFGWRAMFLYAGLASLAWLVPWLLFTGGESGHAKPKQGEGPSWRMLLGRREVWGTSLGMFALGYVLYFLLSWLPSYLVKERGLSLESMAVLGSFPFWAMAAASVFGGWSSDRWIRSGGSASRVRKLYAVGGLILCGVVLLPAPWVTSAIASVTLITAACAFLGLFTSNVWAITQSLAGPLAAGRWTGFQNFIGNLGGVASPYLTGWIVAETGSFTLAFVTATVVLLMGAAAYALMTGRVEALSWTGSPAAAPTHA